MLTDYLKKIPLFSHVKDAQLKEIASRCRKVLFGKGATVFQKTDPGTELFVVLSGKLKAVLEDEQGSEMVLAGFEQGDFFGELGLLDGKGRSATIIADKDSELAVLSKDVFLDLLQKDPKMAVELLATLVDRLRKADEMIESLAFLEVGERLVRSLLESAQGGDDRTAGYLRTKKLTHKDIASRIGSSREAVSKCMKVLATKGIIRDGEGEILIAHDAVDMLRENSRK
ncbi:MAG: hypothetical protein A2X56_11565 [Nitrospirae bacterium GWC2_57_13]|jgi:CRP/FNR family transcriptional regulator, cyclic AMP receptor protein|nr:MAG: hypothetical protein A2072_03765 [Nitrospirae bacterium GWC1_57_7]OGW27496.1 MAG: hypothetical protein A2X56_11565 [Nitrospirae bacterium GWC2_57_13]OGW44660.1 MAG: hypothetical protein A2X57_06540 [Nitrospirae bacterium GWD2_57_8]HAS53125.1 Crp/Fnr family transcriptional regulator [Nitrospiraceae bacterium]